MPLWTLRPLRRPQAVFAAIAVVLAGSLAALTWRVVEQDRAIDAQRRGDELARSASAIETALVQLRSRVEERLELAVAGGGPAADTIAGLASAEAAAVVFDGGTIAVTPKGAVLYVPDAEYARSAGDDRFETGERHEFQDGDFAAAAAFYRAAAAASEPARRGGALLRLGRVQIKANARREALATYQELIALGPMPIEGIPADLLGREARLDVLRALGRDDERAREASELARDLESGAWQLPRSTYLFYRDRIGVTNRPGGSAAFAAALEGAWREWRRRATDDRFRLATTIDGNSDPTLVFARGTRQRLAVLLATPAWLRSQLSATLTSLSSGFVEVALADDKGGRILGGRDPQPGTARIERAVPALGWTIAVTSAVPPEVRDQQTARRRLLFASSLLAIGLVLLASYAVGRSIARELAVARLQADFVAAVSHEFRTPLSSLRQLTELLSDGRVSDDARRTVYYQRLQRETERLQRLVEGLLDFNRIEAGAHEFRFDTFDAAEFLGDLARDFTEEAESRAHRLDGRIPPARVIVRADREALGRAVWNLLDNAVKYSPNGTAVSLTLAETDGSVRIVVQDDGLGIPSDQQSRIFQKFVRAPGHSGIRGTGLGLTMALAIARGHGGDITVSSEVDRGSVFTLTLPAVAQPGIADVAVRARVS